VHRLKIRPIVHNQEAPPTIPPSYIRVRAVMWTCGEGQTQTDTDASDQYTFLSSTTHAKCKSQIPLRCSAIAGRRPASEPARELVADLFASWSQAG